MSRAGRFVSIAFVLGSGSGCGGSQATAARSGDGVSDGASLLDCTRVADHVANAVVEARPGPASKHATVKELVSARCDADAWTSATKECLFGAGSVKEGRACVGAMTDEQRSSLRAAVRAMRAPAEPADTDATNDTWLRHVVEEATPGSHTCQGTQLVDCGSDPER